MSLVQLKQIENGAAINALINGFYQGNISSSNPAIIAPLDEFLNIEFANEADNHIIRLDPLGNKTTYEIFVGRHESSGPAPAAHQTWQTLTIDQLTDIGNGETLKAQIYRKIIIHRYNADGIPERTWAVEFYGGAANQASGFWACIKVTPWG